MKIYQKLSCLSLIFPLIVLVVSCGEDDPSKDVDNASFNFEALAEGKGQIILESSEGTVSIEGIATLETFGVSSVNDGPRFKEINYSIEVEEGSDRFSLTVYWPESEGDDMPEGQYPIKAANLTNFPSSKFVEVLISADGIESFGPDFTVENSGFVEISNASQDYYSMDFTMDAIGLVQFFDDATASATGGAKFRRPE
jgi:hypothetical protein